MNGLLPFLPVLDWMYSAPAEEITPVGSWATTDRQTDWTQQTHQTDFGHKARETAWTIGE